MATVETVLGAVDARSLGITLTHEHLFIGWPGWQYDPVALDEKVAGYDALIARLVAARAAGVRTVVDAGPAELGRDVRLLQRIASDSGLNVVASTGFYHESWGFPVYLRMRSVEELTEILLHELTDGIDGAGVRAGAIKVASAGAEVGRHERRGLIAAAAAATATGVPVLTHSSGPAVAMAQAEALLGGGVPAEKIQVGHCDSFPLADLRRLLATGVFVAFDQVVYEQRIDRVQRAEVLAALIEEGWASQLMLSHDQIGILGGRQIALAASTRDFTYVVGELLPALRALGASEAALTTITVGNPARWLGRAGS